MALLQSIPASAQSQLGLEQPSVRAKAINPPAPAPQATSPQRKDPHKHPTVVSGPKKTTASPLVSQAQCCFSPKTNRDDGPPVLCASDHCQVPTRPLHLGHGNRGAA